MDLKPEDIIVMRSQFGNYRVLFYRCKSKEPAVINSIKMLYQQESGCPYCQIRPISYPKWIKMTDDNPKKFRTSNKKSS